MDFLERIRNGSYMAPANLTTKLVFKESQRPALWEEAPCLGRLYKHSLSKDKHSGIFTTFRLSSVLASLF